MVRQFAYKSYRIGEQERQVFNGHFADSGIECSKELIFRKHVGFGQQVHQR